MSEPTPLPIAQAPRRNSFLMVLPLILFLGHAALFWFRLGDGA